VLIHCDLISDFFRRTKVMVHAPARETAPELPAHTANCCCGKARAREILPQPTAPPRPGPLQRRLLRAAAGAR
jgi:hypothetical protein